MADTKTPSTVLSPRIKPKHVDSLTDELASAAGLTHDEATRVLKTLGLDKLVRNANETQELLEKRNSAHVLLMDQSEIVGRAAAASADAFKLANLRISVKPALAVLGHRA